MSLEELTPELADEKLKELADKMNGFIEKVENYVQELSLEVRSLLSERIETFLDKTPGDELAAANFLISAVAADLLAHHFGSVIGGSKALKEEDCKGSGHFFKSFTDIYEERLSWYIEQFKEITKNETPVPQPHQD